MFSRDDNRIAELLEYLVTEHNGERSNIRCNGDDITLLGDSLMLGIDEEMNESGYISTSMNEKFQKVKLKI